MDDIDSTDEIVSVLQLIKKSKTDSEERVSNARNLAMKLFNPEVVRSGFKTMMKHLFVCLKTDDQRFDLRGGEGLELNQLKA